MPVTTPPSITALPAPPDPNDRATFNTRAYPWSVAQQTLATEVGAVATNVAGNAADAAASTALTDADRVQTGLDATATAADRVQTGLDRTQTGLDRIAAADSAVQASKLNLGNKSSPPTVDNQGDALLAGTTYYDTTLAKWRVWTGVAWGDGISSIAGVASLNGLTGNVVLPPVQTLAYPSRATLRSQTPAAGEQAIVDGLGLFVWESGSTEPDDDESCFATASGRWLLQAAHWDLVDSWQAPDDAVRDEDDEDELLRFTASFNTRVLNGTATCTIISLVGSTSTSFTGTVTGAVPGDRVIATPPGELGQSNAETGRLSYHAWVSAVNTVTVMLTNASASTANTNPATRTAWPITVIKS